MHNINNMEIGENFIRLDTANFTPEHKARFPMGMKFKSSMMYVPNLDFATMTFKLCGRVERDFHKLGFTRIMEELNLPYFYKVDFVETFFPGVIFCFDYAPAWPGQSQIIIIGTLTIDE